VGEREGEASGGTKLVVGLGNPGIEYQFTPHNFGFLVVDRLAEQAGVAVANRRCRALTAGATIAGAKVVLAKPDTYMNLSGLSVRELVREFGADPAQDVIIVHDELDLPLGRLQIRQRGGSAGHNGIESVMGALGTNEFIRVRIGIAPEHEVKDGARYVLQQFKKAQLEQVSEMIDRAADAVGSILKDGIAAAMNKFNRREEKDS
jgi:PTH1 family peptidyl-tRNA hydrolase